jgi:hypothetical protein
MFINASIEAAINTAMKGITLSIGSIAEQFRLLSSRIQAQDQRLLSIEQFLSEQDNNKNQQARNVDDDCDLTDNYQHE